MKKIALVFAFAAMSFAAMAQHDTLQISPFVYCYNWPNIFTQHDSIPCIAREINYIWGASANYTDFAVYQHTDVPLKVVGVAFSCDGYDLLPVKLTIYDSNMNVLICGTTAAISNDFVYVADADTCKGFMVPGITHSFGDHSGNGWFDFDILLKMYYFGSKAKIEITGGFWIGIVHYHIPSGTYQCTNNYVVLENHSDPPYLINNTKYKLKKNGSWVEYTEDGILPELFVLVEPECNSVEGVTVTETDGCVDVVWDSVEGQTQWQVFLQGPGVSQTDTVDVCHWHYCGYDTTATYTVSVCASCYRPQDNVWSEWSDAVYFGNVPPQSIATAAGAQFSLSPNPASGQVTVTAEEGLRHIEVYDIRRALVYSAAADGTTAVVETKAWPAGQYVVSVETRAGKGSRVLMVAR